MKYDRLRSTNTITHPPKYAHGLHIVTSWDPFQYLIRRLIVWSREVSKPGELYLELFDHSEIWQVQHRCPFACQISKRWDNLNYQSCDLDSSRDLTIRRLIGYWNGSPFWFWVWSLLTSSFRFTSLAPVHSYDCHSPREATMTNRVTLRPRQKWPPFRRRCFWNAFSWMKIYEYRLKFELNLFLRFQFIIFQPWFR